MADFDVDEFLRKRTPQTVGETPDTFDPDAFLARRSEQPAAQPELTDTAMLNPAITGAAFAAEAGNVGAAAQRIGQAAARPAVESAKGLYQVYRANPIGAVVDAALVGTGNIPVYGPVSAGSSGMQGLYERYIKPLKGAATEASIAASEGGQATKEAYKAIKEAAPKSFGEAMKSAYAAGGNNAVGQLLRSPEGQQVISSVGQAANAEKYLGAIPSPMQQAGRMVKPLAVGAARVAGPAALAYDVNQSLEFARQQQLGERLAQGQGRRAQQAFRNMNVQYGYQPTAAEAQNILAGGAARDIQAFGGEDRLRRIIREQAAQRVVGPIAPGQ